jgi:hypothetical protein
MGWTRAQGKQAQGYGGHGAVAAIVTGGRRGRVWSTPTHDILFKVSYRLCRINDFYGRHRGVHRVRPLRLLPSYGACCNSFITITSREDHAGFFAKKVSNDLSSEFRSSDITTSPGHLDGNILILKRSISPHITLI